MVLEFKAGWDLFWWPQQGILGIFSDSHRVLEILECSLLVQFFGNSPEFLAVEICD